MRRREIFFSFVPFNHPDAEIMPRRENTMRARGAHMSGIIRPVQGRRLSRRAHDAPAKSCAVLPLKLPA